MGKRVATPPALTLAERATRSGLLAEISATTTAVIERSVADADRRGRESLRVVSCHRCDAPKACCSVSVLVYLHEALPIAARLLAEGRDTPALRGALRASAEAMENTPRAVHARAGRPCVFLDGDQRCTVYADRPAPCGVALMYSPATACSAPGTATLDPYPATLHREAGMAMSERTRVTLGLPAITHAYVGMLPRMVLLALQAWARTDYAPFLARQVGDAVARVKIANPT